mgnify:FL=1
MNDLITSNFNLLHNNNIWTQLKKNFKVEIDKNFNNFFFVINNKNILRNFDNIHIVLLLEKNNLKEILEKVESLSNKKNKLFFLYLILENNNLKDNNLILKSLARIINKLNKNLNENLFIKIFNNLNDSYFNLRNKTYLRFPFDIKFLGFLKKNVIENLRALSSKPYKLIILDCDNTLWGGILDEDCIDGIAYGEDGNGLVFYEFQKKLKELKNKGFLLSISSKNSEKKVWATMKNRNMILRKGDFVSPKINWNEKHINIKKILNELTLRPEDTVFIDDNILETQKVKKYIKKINIINFSEPTDTYYKIKKDNRFQKLRILKEDLKKYKQYKIKSQFEDQKTREGVSIKFYKNLKQRLKPLNCNKFNFNRALQLFNKTNQFNFSLNRYSNLNLKNKIKDKKYRVLLFELKDKFGSHGIISSCILKKNNKNIEIVDFVVSCRVISRFVEDYMIYYIVKKNKAKTYIINYDKTHLNRELIPQFLKKSYFNFLKKEKNKNIYEIKKCDTLDNVKNIF